MRPTCRTGRRRCSGDWRRKIQPGGDGCPWIATLVSQIKSDFRSLGVKVNHAASSACAPTSPTLTTVYDSSGYRRSSVFGTDPGIIYCGRNGDNVWTKEA